MKLHDKTYRLANQKVRTMETPEETAKRIRDDLPWQMDFEAWCELEKDIAAAIRAAVEAERESCGMRLLDFTNGFTEQMRADPRMNELRYALDHFFVAMVMVAMDKLPAKTQEDTA